MISRGVTECVFEGTNVKGSVFATKPISFESWVVGSHKTVKIRAHHERATILVC